MKTRPIVGALLLGLLLWAQPASAAITLLATCGDPSASPGPACSGGINTSGATLLVAINGTNGASCPTDSGSNTWTNVVSITGGEFSGTYSLCYVNAPSGTGAGHTFTCGGTLCGVSVTAYSGTTTTSPLDVSCSGNSGSPTTCSGAVTPANNGSLIVSGTGGPFSAPQTVDSSLTIRNEVQGAGGVSYGASIADRVQATAASINPGWNDAATLGTGVNVTAVFKPAAGGGATSHPCSALRLLGVGCELHP